MIKNIILSLFIGSAMTIAKKTLIGALIGSTLFLLITAGLVATISFNIADKFIEKSVSHHLTATREIQKDQIYDYLDTIKKQIITFSNNEMMVTASKAFKTHFHNFPILAESNGNDLNEMKSALSQYYNNEFGARYKSRNPHMTHSTTSLLNAVADKGIYAQYYFIADNPNPLGAKDALNTINPGGNYSRAHNRFHPIIRQYLNEFEYYDIFIIDPETGHIVYSVFKELDFGTSLTTGPYANSGLADVFRKAVKSNEANYVAFSRFKSYTPSYEDPASFVASPIQNKNGETIAILAFQMPIDKINAIMSFQKNWRDNGLGETGESFLVSEDYMTQTIRRQLIEHPEQYFSYLKNSDMDPDTLDTIKSKETNIGFQTIRSDSVKEALSGRSGLITITDLREEKVLSAYTFIEFLGSRFALLSQMDVKEAFEYRSAIITSVAVSTFIITFIVLISIGFIVWRLTRQLSKLLDNAVSVATQVSRGKRATITGHERQDEVGKLMSALEHMQTELISGFEQREESSQRLTQALDNVQSGVIVTDADKHIIYFNKAISQLLQHSEQHLNKGSVHFDKDTIIGSHVDSFHENFSKNSTRPNQIQLGHSIISTNSNSVIDTDGDYIGTVIEWRDETDEISFQNEIDDLVATASGGDLSKRINITNKADAFKKLGEGLNSLMEINSQFVNDMSNVFKNLAKGDLSQNLNTHYQGEFENIKVDANNTLEQLKEIMTKVSDTSDTVENLARDVTNGNSALSQRTESQAASLEETAASMEEINSTVAQSADNADEANHSAIGAKSKAQQGGEIVQEAITAMSDILESSKKINDIISVIDEIAFQTNLLALNAAVEAARAGEQGRGFAVVASEVRTLSQRSANAAKEIKDLIQDSVVKVELGSDLVNRSGETLTDIVSAVEDVADRIEQMATAAQEQRSGINQINSAISQMDTMTQQNAELVDQTSTASHEMQEQMLELNQLISFFKHHTHSDNSGKEQILQAINH